MRILAVDDDPVFLDLLCAMLGRLGQGDVIPFATAGAALAALDDTAQTFDCILSDMQMPDMDGAVLYRRRARAQGPSPDAAARRR